MTNAHNIHSTDIDREQREVNDPAFTRYTQRSFSIAVGIGFMLSIGSIFIGLTYGEAIDTFLKTKTGFWTLVGVIITTGFTWFILKVRAMIQEK